MTVKDIREQIELIRGSMNDPEVAHSTEDGLYRQVLQSIADGTCENPVECAKEALKTMALNFCRWYA